VRWWFSAAAWSGPSAWYLARAGHEVVVLDRQAGSGREASSGNAGEISPGASVSWVAPGIPLQAPKWLLMRHRPLVVRPRLDPAMLIWGLMMLRNCTAARYELLDPEACVRAEPALARVRGKVAGGLRLPDDEIGDCFNFTQALAIACGQQGVDFRHGTRIERIAADTDRVSGLVTDRGMVTGDAYIVALGSYSSRLLRPIGIRAPIYPVKGYSLTVPITDPAGAPGSSVVNETYKVAIARLCDRIRVGGMAELAGYDLELREAPRRTLQHVVCDLFRAAATSARQFWYGLRPMTPDSPPLVGPTRYRNLWAEYWTRHPRLDDGLRLRTGHGRPDFRPEARAGRRRAHARAVWPSGLSALRLGKGTNLRRLRPRCCSGERIASTHSLA
jgi:glycine/D-amino acid oxidase-like deaminating enzyme